MKDKKTQHQLGQHYSKEEELIVKYSDILRKQTDKVVVDPFCGEGHLLFFYLELFDRDKQLEILNNKGIMALDLFEDNVKHVKAALKKEYGLSNNLLDEICKVNNSLINNDIPENSFILTNPPYLAKNVCKKNYPSDFDIYFKEEHKSENDYFEIALKLYGNFEGVWIVPSNLLSSDIMAKIRKKLIFSMEDITVYMKKTFEDTDISVCTFHINPSLNNKKKKIIFVNDNKEEGYFDITDSGNLSKEWEDIKVTKNDLKIYQGYIDTDINYGNEKITLLDVDYSEKVFSLSKEDKDKLLSNVLILRATDTGTEDGKIGLYTIKEIWDNDEAQGLVTKISSRVYTPLFFNDISIDQQLKIKDNFNKSLNELRSKYKSIFLTNYKNSSNGMQRKRISFKETFSLINYLFKKSSKK